MQWGIVGLVVLAGMGLAMQAAVNARLRQSVESPIFSALISFAVGAAALSLVAISGIFGRGKLTGLGPTPWWAWVGGLLGAFYVAIAVVALPRLGSAAVIACAVAGQLAAGLVLDHFGWLGVPRSPLTLTRLAGVALLFCGVALLQKK